MLNNRCSIINTNKHIRLTQDRPSQSGWLWSRLPLTPTSFEIEFEFRVDGKANSLYGDGFAMWLTRGRAQQGPVFGSVDQWEGLGVFFDTYANSRHAYVFPEVLAILNDGTKIYDVQKDGAGQELGRCSVSQGLSGDLNDAQKGFVVRLTFAEPKSQPKPS